MAAPALFYLYIHNNAEDAASKKMRQLIARTKAVWHEAAQPRPDFSQLLEEALNAEHPSPAATEILKMYLHTTSQMDMDHRLVILAIGKSAGKIVFERNPLPPPTYWDEVEALSNAYFAYPAQLAVERAEEILGGMRAYEAKRTEATVGQICAIEEPVVVMAGLSHWEWPDLAERVRPVERHLPFEGYPVTFDARLYAAFRVAGRVEIETLARHSVEQAALTALISRHCQQIGGRLCNLAAYQYATVLSPDQLGELREYVGRLRRLRIPAHDIFESFFTAKAQLPPFLEMVEVARLTVPESDRFDWGNANQRSE